MLVTKQRVVVGVEYNTGKRTEAGENISGRCGIFAALKPGPKLTARLQQVDVVAAHVVLRQVNDGAHQRALTVVVR